MGGHSRNRAGDSLALVVGNYMLPNGGTLNCVPESVMRDSKSLTSQRRSNHGQVGVGSGSESRSPNLH